MLVSTHTIDLLGSWIRRVFGSLVNDYNIFHKEDYVCELHKIIIISYNFTKQMGVLKSPIKCCSTLDVFMAILHKCEHFTWM